jgi:putative ABC transport system ATP-binding protein
MGEARTEMEPVVSISNLTHFFGDGVGRKQILHDVCLDIAGGEIVLLTGPSGSGKSTLLTLVGALRTVQEGTVRVFGNELCEASVPLRRSVRRRIGYIFQEHNLLPFLSARRNVEIALQVEDAPPPSEVERQARAVLAAMGLAAEADRLPATLSGGEKQRVAMARALVHRPQLILADEPTASLDRENGHQCVEFLRRLARDQGCPVFLVTHDSRIYDIADRILRIDDGRVLPL